MRDIIVFEVNRERWLVGAEEKKSSPRSRLREKRITTENVLTPERRRVIIKLLWEGNRDFSMHSQCSL